jgi:hypothetical protein
MSYCNLLPPETAIYFLLCFRRGVSSATFGAEDLAAGEDLDDDDKVVASRDQDHMLLHNLRDHWNPDKGLKIGK